jgi:para-aminobenzoate synthetase/4-amino-4-deoxychorismate lyase
MGGHFNVAIRTVIVDCDEGRAEYGTGSGITWDSTMGPEYEEAILKARVLQADKETFSLLEVIRWDGDQYLLLAEHLARVEDSAAYFGFRYSEHEVRSALTKHSVVLQSTLRETAARIKLLVDRQGHVSVTTAEVDLLPFVDSPENLSFGMNPVHVVVSATPIRRTDVSLYHKTTLRGTYDAARAAARGVDDVILINDRGEVTEATIANIVVRFGDVWLTPPLEAGCLPGVYRSELLERGAIEEARIPIGDLTAADDIAVVNSVRGWRRAVVVPRTDFTGRPH